MFISDVAKDRDPGRDKESRIWDDFGLEDELLQEIRLENWG